MQRFRVMSSGVCLCARQMRSSSTREVFKENTFFLNADKTLKSTKDVFAHLSPDETLKKEGAKHKKSAATSWLGLNRVLRPNNTNNQNQNNNTSYPYERRSPITSPSQEESLTSDTVQAQKHFEAVYNSWTKLAPRISIHLRETNKLQAALKARRKTNQQSGKTLLKIRMVWLINIFVVPILLGLYYSSQVRQYAFKLSQTPSVDYDALLAKKQGMK